MTLTPARLIRSLVTGYPLPVPSTMAGDGLQAQQLRDRQNAAD